MTPWNVCKVYFTPTGYFAPWPHQYNLENLYQHSRHVCRLRSLWYTSQLLAPSLLSNITSITTTIRTHQGWSVGCLQWYMKLMTFQCFVILWIAETCFPYPCSIHEGWCDQCIEQLYPGAVFLKPYITWNCLSSVPKAVKTLEIMVVDANYRDK